MSDFAVPVATGAVLCVLVLFAYVRLSKLHASDSEQTAGVIPAATIDRGNDVNIVILLDGERIGSTWCYLARDAKTAREKCASFMRAVMYENGLTEADGQNDTPERLATPLGGWRLTKRAVNRKDETVELTVEIHFPAA